MSDYLFIDDSGPKEWKTPYSRNFVENPPARTDQNRVFWQDNYFVLAGVHIASDYIAELNSDINSEKEKVFGTKFVELHSANLRFPKTRKKYYIDKYNISVDELKAFIDDYWYGLFDNYPIESIAIVVDKRYFLNARHNGKNSLDIAAEALFDRNELHPWKECRIVFDQMDSQIRKKSGQQGQVLQISDTKMELDGMLLKKYHHISVEFDKSCNSNSLQLADMVAYNTWRQFVDYGDEWDKHSPDGEHRELPEYSYFERISNSFYHNSNNEVSGYGIVKLPDPFNRQKK